MTKIDDILPEIILDPDFKTHDKIQGGVCFKYVGNFDKKPIICFLSKSGVFKGRICGECFDDYKKFRDRLTYLEKMRREEISLNDRINSIEKEVCGVLMSRNPFRNLMVRQHFARVVGKIFLVNVGETLPRFTPLEDCLFDGAEISFRSDLTLYRGVFCIEKLKKYVAERCHRLKELSPNCEKVDNIIQQLVSRLERFIVDDRAFYEENVDPIIAKLSKELGEMVEHNTKYRWAKRRKKRVLIFNPSFLKSLMVLGLPPEGCETSGYDNPTLLKLMAVNEELYNQYNIDDCKSILAYILGIFLKR